MSCQRVGYYTGFILFETYLPRVNKCLHLMFKDKTPFCGMVDDSTMVVTLSVCIIVLCTNFMGEINNIISYNNIIQYTNIIQYNIIYIYIYII